MGHAAFENVTQAGLRQQLPESPMFVKVSHPLLYQHFLRSYEQTSLQSLQNTKQ